MRYVDEGTEITRTLYTSLCYTENRHHISQRYNCLPFVNLLSYYSSKIYFYFFYFDFQIDFAIKGICNCIYRDIYIDLPKIIMVVW